MSGQLSFISSRPLHQIPRPIAARLDTFPRFQQNPYPLELYKSAPSVHPHPLALPRPAPASFDGAPKVRPVKTTKPIKTMNQDSTRSSARVIRTVPRSRHSRSPSPLNSGADEMRYEPYTVTAQGYPVNNKLKKSKYATSIDERGYLAVYEFQLNEQTIMWDYTSGFVHLTGIWKALGNSKADIVRLVDNHPELEGVIRRIRGGFLKIQGTWVPFELCKRLALRTCYTIRHALISVFGPDFPEECLKPDAKGYGTLTLDDSGIDKKRKKRKVVSVPETEPDVGVALRMSEREKRPRVAHQSRPRVNSTSSSENDGFSSPSHSSQKTLPPPLPRVLELTEGGYYAYTDLLDLLRATRSLQKLSSGDPAEWADQGGLFNLSGSDATFHWDGNDQLELFPATPPSSKAATEMHSLQPSDTRDWRQALEMRRKSSTSSTSQYPSSVSTNGPLTPPYCYKSLASTTDVGVPYTSLQAMWPPHVVDGTMPSPKRSANAVKTAGINIMSEW